MIIPQVKNGILNIDKPQGITSHDVVDVIRKIFPKMKVGHTGTLDPLATGVLPICIGEATKLTNELTCENKTYKVKILLGVETDTYDVTGKIMFASTINKDEIYIKERIKRFIGVQEQMPPIYSAIRIAGKRAYSYAREGKKVDLAPRKIEIYSIEDIKVNLEKREVEFVVECSKGTYIRSLANDIGKKIGCGAIMTELRRIRTGNFNIINSIPLYDFLKLQYEEMISKITSIEEYYKEAKRINLSKEDYMKFLNGVQFEMETKERIVTVYFNNDFKGLGIVNDNIMKRYVVE
ncbi:MAG: tRNA pseudouridine(55) synthase TruB [Clostridia bacterium]|nr:tRNA pseudouridine(55) synthase TruB [Clostridia bacterium]